MALTRDFKELVKARMERDPAFRAALLAEAMDALQSADKETGEAILRDYFPAHPRSEPKA